MGMERSSLAFFAAAAVAVLWMALVRPYLPIGGEATSNVVHGIIVALIAGGGFTWAVRIARKHGELDERH